MKKNNNKNNYLKIINKIEKIRTKNNAINHKLLFR